MVKVAWPASTAVLHDSAVVLAVLVLAALLIVSLDVGFGALLRTIGL